MPRPPLSRERIVDAGVRIVGTVGFPGLTLRSVASQVHATVTGVQRQISLTDLVHAVAGELVPTMPQFAKRGDWRRRLRDWAVEVRSWLMKYPGLARFLLSNRWDSDIGLDRVEQIFGILTGAGVDDRCAAQASRALYWFVLSSVDLDEYVPILTAELTTRTLLSAPDRWQRLSAATVPYNSAEATAQYLLGFELLVDGISKRSHKGAKMEFSGLASLPVPDVATPG